MPERIRVQKDGYGLVELIRNCLWRYLVKLQYFHLAYAAPAFIILYAMEPTVLLALGFNVSRVLFRQCVERASSLKRDLREYRMLEENI